MAGLAPDAARYFKFLFILVLYTLVMTLFVRPVSSHNLLVLISFCMLELSARDLVHKRGHRYPSVSTYCTVPDDLCRFFCPSQYDNACSPMAAMALSTQVHVGSAMCE
jgi:hypothetical protein